MNTMMMECPRCGFAQPKDQFCANCGLNVDQYLSKPTPLLIRILQNPNLHLSLIGIAVAGVIAYIIYSQSTLVSRQIGQLLDLPLSSRDAADPSDSPSPSPARAARESRKARAQEDEDQVAATDAAMASAPAAETVETEEPAAKLKVPADAVKLSATNKIEVTHWEVPKEAISNLLALSEKVGEGTAGRAHFYTSGVKISEEIGNVGRKISTARNLTVQANSQLTIETPPTTTEAFQFGLFFQLSKVENKEAQLKWESTLVLPQAETAAEAASGNPAVRATVESTMNGSASLTSSSLLLILVEPQNRSPREEYLARAGEGPWAIFTSPEFRAGLTEWVVLVQIK